MGMFSLSFMDHRTLAEGDTMSNAEAVDVGPFTIVDLVITVHSAATGTSPTLTIKHAARLAEDAWLDLDEALVIDLTATGTTWRHVSAVTRFLGWFLSGTVETGPEVTIDIVAKG